MLWLIGVVNFFYVFLRAFQTLNIAHGKRLRMVVTSCAIAYADIFLVAVYAHHGVSVVLCTVVGITGGLGCIASYYLHRWLRP